MSEHEDVLEQKLVRSGDDEEVALMMVLRQELSGVVEGCSFVVKKSEQEEDNPAGTAEL